MVKKVRGKGQGVIAVQTIEKGEAVMRETPLVLQISNPGEDVLGWQGLDIKGAIKMMLNKTAEVIPKEMKDTVWALAKQGKGDVLEDVMMTNAFDVSVAGVEHDGLYPGIAVRTLIFVLQGNEFGVCVRGSFADQEAADQPCVQAQVSPLQ